MISGEDEAKQWVRDFDRSEGTGRFHLLERYADLLLEESARQNLIAASTIPALWQRHIADSAQLLTGVPRETSSWLDIGSGAGLPGLVVSILRPQLKVTLVEPRKRRADWLQRVSDVLELGNAQVICLPIERTPVAAYDVISARAVASLSNIIAFAEQFSTKCTLWRLPKGRSAHEELQNLSGWEHTFHVEQSLTDREAGIITGTLLGRAGRRS